MAGILYADGRPIFFTSERVGRRGHIFRMHKFRTMHTVPGGARITSARDARIFGFGSFLRKTKLDELPQLWDVLRGKMSIVGPRPEDILIVNSHYRREWLETLEVRPGLTSPGSLYYYSLVEQSISDADPETHYLSEILPAKIELDLDYVRHGSLVNDLSVCFRTFLMILAKVLRLRSTALIPKPRSTRSHSAARK